jgi:Tol biopolymer transport system component
MSYRRIALAAAVLSLMAGVWLVTQVACSEPGGEQEGWAPMPYPSDTWPSWSPDGETILFTTNRGPRTTLYELRFETGDIKPVIPWTSADEGSYSPDGHRIVFAHGPRVGIHNRETGSTALLNAPDNPEDVGFYPSFLDSERVIYMRRPRHHEVNCLLAERVAGDASAAKILIEADHHVGRSATGPGGRRIAYAKVVDSRLRGGQTDICVYDLESESTRVVFVSPFIVERLSWTPDGNRLIANVLGYSDQAPFRFFVDVNDGTMIRLGLAVDQFRAIAGTVVMSPNGEWLCYPASSSEGYGVTLWRCRADGTDVQELTHLPAYYYERYPATEPIGGCELIYGDPETGGR